MLSLKQRKTMTPPQQKEEEAEVCLSLVQYEDVFVLYDFFFNHRFMF